LSSGKQPTVYGDGEQSRDFTYIENTINGNILAAENPDIAGVAMNCACGDQITLNELLERLRKILGVDTEAIYSDPRPGDIKHSFAAIDKISSYGFKPTVSFDDGLKRTVEFFTK
jgi:nucleoside-diphosphate-sugar epimerase